MLSLGVNLSSKVWLRAGAQVSVFAMSLTQRSALGQSGFLSSSRGLGQAARTCSRPVCDTRVLAQARRGLTELLSVRNDK